MRGDGLPIRLEVLPTDWAARRQRRLVDHKTGNRMAKCGSQAADGAERVADERRDRRGLGDLCHVATAAMSSYSRSSEYCERPVPLWPRPRRSIA